jgi:prevent-host-death family protein
MPIIISAKELRLHLSDYLQRAMGGEEIEIIYRSRPAVRLLPQTTVSQYNGTNVARQLAALAPRLQQTHPKSSTSRATRALRDELMQSDPKYAKYLRG